MIPVLLCARAAGEFQPRGPLLLAHPVSPCQPEFREPAHVGMGAVPFYTIPKIPLDSFLAATYLDLTGQRSHNRNRPDARV